jgi:hypothetical protein
MKLGLRDLPALGQPLIVLGVILAVAAAGVVYTGKLIKQGRADLAAAQVQLKEANERVSRSGEEVDTLRRYIGPYQELERRGIVGEEQRLNWIDALRVANIDAQLYGVDYEVGSQVPYSFVEEVNAAGLPVQQSVMKLKLGLLYETDLLTFFRVLADQHVGEFAVNQCALQRLTSDVSKPLNQPTLRAECDVAWVTIPPPAAAEGGS